MNIKKRERIDGVMEIINLTNLFFMKNYLKSLIKVGSGDSSKAFGLVMSVVIGSFIGLVIGIVLLYDGLKDGTLDSDLWMVGWFLVADSVFIFGGGLTKTLTDLKEIGPKSEILIRDEKENNVEEK